ncbi:helix-turn-helix domain-containing protein [Pseudonocardia cypriaca]|uniref:GAF domain-containing protein n=1 Tax=Pseudonocardia cypriaca TaxID=882449 RepID=A0A543FSQ1_9PSEU|nr:helix-turn-helix domain-containing protein [Pseudonocardia cypriaca]TQM36774.1 GAF domain-containing protein [Pseudonocardia cypriaca]
MSNDVHSIPVDTVVTLLEAAAADRDADDAEIRDLLAGLDLPADAAARVSDGVRQLRVGSERWRRRGQELSALFSSARELAQLRDVDKLLERLVERAHDLVGTDVTYLSEFDMRTRELRVRTTLGTVAPTFLGLRVPPGMGLASLVVQRRQPCWTSSYSGMTQAPHDAHIDATVAAEGLVSLLGVPLLAGEEVIGVLFAANRVEHSFSPEEISLLSAFADHAAIVLQTARLLARTQDAAEETRRAYGQLARHVEAMERASGVHSDLTTLVLQGGDTTAVAGALGKALRCRVTVLDADLHPTASAAGPTADAPAPVGSGRDREDGPRRDEIRRAVDESRRSGRCVTLGRPGHEVVVAVVAGQTFLGALVLEPGTVEFGPVEHRTAERAAQITALLSLKQEALIEAEQRVRGDLLADLLSGDPRRRAGVAQRAQSRGIRTAELRTLVVLSLPAEHRRLAARAAGRAAGGGLIGEHADQVVALTCESDPAAAATLIHTAVRRAIDHPTLAVAAALGDVPRDVRAQLEAATACARVLPVLGITDSAATTDEFLPYTALFGPGETRVSTFVHNLLGPLLEWDATRGGNLLTTLAVYLDSRLSPVAAGRALHLHKNTVLQRLERITELLGDDWQEPDRLFRISVAVRVARLSATTLRDL